MPSAAGINVVTTRGAFHHPASMDPELRAKLQAACELGGASVHSTGSSPGFITEAVPLVLTSIQPQLDALTIDEYADLSQRNSPELLFDAGRPLIQVRATWYCTADLDPALEVRETGWHVSVDGDAPLEVTLRMPIPLDRIAAVSPAYTANRAVNAVPFVCAADPGIHATLDFPQVVTTLG